MYKKIEKEIKKEIPENDYKYHVSLVIKYTKHLAEIENENVDIAMTAALLHDIGGYKHGWENHEESGAIEAEKILTKFNISKDITNEVKTCIKTHRGSSKDKPKTKLAEILRDADALSHFDAVPWLIHLGLYRFDNNIGKSISWVLKKLERDFNNKLHLEESKRIALPKYKAAKLLLER